MRYLNEAALSAMDERAFLSKRPYPWANPSDALTPEGLAALLAEQPDLKHFDKSFGMAREYGQKAHDRYELLYDGSQPLPPAWQEFLKELEGPFFRGFVRRMTGRKDFVLRFQWQYAVRGCSVSPHTDRPKKIASFLVYLNTPKDWDPVWGGQTLVLDDGGKLDWRSAPEYEDFAGETASNSMAPHAFMFVRTEHSWHAVRELQCPEGSSRKLFSVVVEVPPPWRERIRSRLAALLRRPGSRKA